MTPVDKIFTRLGASDKLLERKSTFFIEMEETKAVLDRATPNSLAVLDELGRGTSTYDGLSIADAVISFVADRINVRPFLVFYSCSAGVSLQLTTINFALSTRTILTFRMPLWPTS